MDRTTVFPFGVPSNEPEYALFRDVSWSVGDEECWAVISSSSSSNRSNLLKSILAQTRFHPPQSASHPILSALPPISRPPHEGGPREADVSDIIQIVTFRTRLAATDGEFEDYTARYFYLRDEDKVTTRQHLEQSLSVPIEGDTDVVLETAKLLQVDHLLDLPLVALSNGQTRRARILRALLAKPELLVLEEPFTGLDISSRALLSTLLAQLHDAKSPRVLVILRPQDDIPPCVTHIALVGSKPGEVDFGPRDEILASPKAKALIAASAEDRRVAGERRRLSREKAAKAPTGEPLVVFNDVSVSYGPRKVLQGINWTIRAGDRWTLSGANGSGKSTLLSVLLGDHPRSFMEDVTLFGKPRVYQATATIQQNIGHVSPEVLNSFPRKWDSTGLTVQDSIVTGFESVFAYRKPTASQQASLTALLKSFAHPALTPSFLTRLFASLTPGEQSLVLLLRALVKSPKLLVLDEPFAGMDAETVRISRRYLDERVGDDVAVVLVTHFDEEVLESVTKVARLEVGRIVEVV